MCWWRGCSSTHFIFLDDMKLTNLLSVAQKRKTFGDLAIRTGDKDNLPCIIEQ
jgi:hypothetical protein